MAPSKRRKPMASTSTVQVPNTNDFISDDAKAYYRSNLKTKVIKERGICNKPPFDAYITKHGWEKFADSPVEANITMCTEFYANMRFINKDSVVLCRGKWVSISAEIINQYCGLEADRATYTEYNQLKLDAGIDEDCHLVENWREMVRAITQPEYPIDEILPHDEFSHIDKKYLTVDMNVWYDFITARLFPVTINSEVQWERIRMLYAFKKNIRINVGSVILSSTDCMIKTTSGWGFHSLITVLCHRAGREDRIDDRLKSPMNMLNFEVFQRRKKQQPADRAYSSNENDMMARVERIEMDVQHTHRLAERCFHILSTAFPAVAAETHDGAEGKDQEVAKE